MASLAALTVDLDPVLELGARPAAAAGAAAVGRHRASRSAGSRGACAHAAPRRDPTGDIAFVVLAAMPGAVVGGRLVHGLAYAGAYALEPTTLLDMGRGSLSLAGAVVGGALTAAYVCRQLGDRAGRLGGRRGVPLLLAIGLAARSRCSWVARARGCRGTAGAASRFGGDGPWASADPGTAGLPDPAAGGHLGAAGHPRPAAAGAPPARGGRAGQRSARDAAPSRVAWWLAGRAAVAVWWRDEPVLGPWGIEGLIALVLLVLTVALHHPQDPRRDPIRPRSVPEHAGRVVEFAKPVGGTGARRAPRRHGSTITARTRCNPWEPACL